MNMGVVCDVVKAKDMTIKTYQQANRSGNDAKAIAAMRALIKQDEPQALALVNHNIKQASRKMSNSLNNPRIQREYEEWLDDYYAE